MAWVRVLLVLLLMSTTAFARDTVNAVLGDESWVARFGTVPGDAVDEDLRLRVHLAYVEARLRASSPAGLSEAQRASRARMLDLLHAYRERGEFPRNHDVQGRRPHFIDEDGRICAVGYLIEQTAGRAAAEAINTRHEWDYVPQIRGIEAWVAASGLTVEELAMIQPAYGWRPRPIEPSDEEIQERTIIGALASARGRVQRCADRYAVWWGDELAVTVSVAQRRVDVHVPRVGGRWFRRCVQDTLESVVAGRVLRGRVWPMNVTYTFAIATTDDERGFAQPPPPS